MTDKEIFAKNLKKYMELHGKSRTDMCEALGFNYFTFTDWINAKKQPRMDKVQKLADYFGIKKSDLIEEKDPMQVMEERAAFDVMIAKNEDLREMLKMYVSLPDDKQKTIKQLVEDYYKAFADGQ